MLDIDKVAEHYTLGLIVLLVRPFLLIYMHIFASLTDCYHVKHRRNDTLHIDVYKFVTQPKWLNVTILWQEEFAMSKRQKKKAPMVEEEPEVEDVTKTEYIYEDTKCISGVEPEYQWGKYID